MSRYETLGEYTLVEEWSIEDMMAILNYLINQDIF